MAIMLIGLVLFLGTHLSTTLRANRRALITRFGEKTYKGGYSLLTGLGLVLIVVGFGSYRASGYIPVWTPPAGLAHAALLLMVPVFVLLAASRDGWIRARAKHPMLLAVKLWATAHLLANGDLGSMLLFGGFLAWGVIARIAVKRREAVEGAPNRAAVRFGRADGIAIGAGLALYVAFVLWLHPLLIGVAVIARG